MVHCFMDLKKIVLDLVNEFYNKGHQTEKKFPLKQAHC
jgi:hypothetical protein